MSSSKSRPYFKSKPKNNKNKPKAKDDASQRVQKLIARAGLTSRRKAEEMIQAGRVTINGKPAQLGSKANPHLDEIRVDGQPITTEAETVYVRLHKPRGYITAVTDDRGRPVVIDLLKDVQERVFPVGRLDYDSEGILLLTNDGDLAHHLTHPSFQVPRHYQVKVKGNPSPGTLQQLVTGVMLDDGPAQALHVERLRPTPGGHTWVEIILTEGRNREVRRMCDAIGHPVQRLKRTKYANLHVEDLYPGEYRPLSSKDIRELFGFLQLPVPKRHRKSRR